MVDKISKEKRSWNMSRIRSKDTKPELIVRKYLFNKGIRYRLHNKDLSGKPDLSNKSKKFAIYVNGCFWHHHERCKDFVWPKSNDQMWKNKINNNVIRDKKNYKALEDNGWKVFIIWECELKLNKRLPTLNNLYQNIVCLN
jgi:DNA mismatch endonuclease (patch repair protein)